MCIRRSSTTWLITKVDQWFLHELYYSLGITNSWVYGHDFWQILKMLETMNFQKTLFMNFQKTLFKCLTNFQGSSNSVASLVWSSGWKVQEDRFCFQATLNGVESKSKGSIQGGNWLIARLSRGVFIQKEYSGVMGVGAVQVLSHREKVRWKRFIHSTDIYCILMYNKIYEAQV